MRAPVLTAGWVLTAILLLLTVLRWTRLDVHSPLTIAATTGAPVLLLPAWVVALVALGLQQRWLALAAIVLIVVDLFTLAPLVAGGRHVSPGQTTALRILALNVQFDHHTGPAVSRQVRATDPDVVVLSELSGTSQLGLDLSQYPYVEGGSPRFFTGSGIWSRYPITDGGTRTVGDKGMTQTTVLLPDGRRVRILQVHTQSPTSRTDIAQWRDELAVLRTELLAARGPTVMAGDFNASRSDPGFARLLHGTGFADAADGRGLLPTWPSSKNWTPPLLRLDHVLVSRDIGVGSVRVLGPTGSDHRAVLADLRL